MTIIHTVSPRTSDVRRPVNGPGSGLVSGSRYARDGLVRSRRPGPSRPVGAPLRYHGTGVAMSVAPHRRRPVPLATTVGLALLAGVITLWLGLVANLGQLANGDPAGSAAHVPDRLAVVRVEAGETLQDVAARVAPDAPARQVAERIRELNDLNSPTVVAGQTLIAPVG
jgi:LysM domain